jgi:hypothetical protein
VRLRYLRAIHLLCAGTMDSQRPSDVSPEAMQARIQQARREAETLKDRIKRKKDELADTTRELYPIDGRE